MKDDATGLTVPLDPEAVADNPREESLAPLELLRKLQEFEHQLWRRNVTSFMRRARPSQR